MYGRSPAGLLFLLVFLVGLPAYGQETLDLQEEGRAYFDFGVFAFEEGDLKDAETNLKIALSLSPDNPYYHHYLGKTYLKMGRYPESMAYLKKAASLAMFNRVLEAPEPGILGENAARWIAALKQKEVRLRPLSLFLKAGRRYDDNVRLDPDDIDLFADESDWATLLYLTGQYDFLIRDRYSAGIGFFSVFWLRDTDHP